MVAENCRIRLHAILVCSLAGLALLGGIRPASAQQDLGAVVCVGSETESVASVGPVRRVVLKDTEVVYRIGVRLADQEEVEEGLLTEAVVWLRGGQVREVGPGAQSRRRGELHGCGAAGSDHRSR